MKHISRSLCAVLSALLLASLSSCFLLRPVTNDPEAVYGSLLDEYAILVQAYQDGTDLSTVEAPATKGLSDELFDSLITILSAMPENEYTDTAEMGYAFYDLDRDGAYECFLMKENGTLYALYASKNGKPYLVEAYRGGSIRQGILTGDGTIFTMHIFKKNDTLTSGEYHYSRFEGGEMVPYRSYVINYESDTAYAVENGEKRDFSKEENSDLNEQTSALFSSCKRHAKEAGLWFQSVAALNSETNTDTTDKPVFDTSSYDALLNSLGTMMVNIPDYSSSDWLNGKYDDLMLLNSPEDYRIYVNLLRSCALNNGYLDGEGTFHPKSIGYAYRDMNNDGSNELFILNEDSTLIALFTLKDSSPVMLWYSGDNGTSTAIDSENHLLASRYPSNNFTSIEYFSYELTPEGDLSPVAYLYGSRYVRKMLKDGKVIVVDQETYSAEFKQVFDKNQGEFWDNSWNESGKMLTFTPLPQS